MLITCGSCPVRGRACDTCVTKTFLEMPPVTSGPAWEEEDHRALDLLCGVGLVSDEDAASARLDGAPWTGLRAAV